MLSKFTVATSRAHIWGAKVHKFPHLCKKKHKKAQKMVYNSHGGGERQQIMLLEYVIKNE